MEELAVYDCKFVYVCGEDNTVADALSRLPYEVILTDEQEHAEEDAKSPLALLNTVTILQPSNIVTLFSVVGALVGTNIQEHVNLSFDKEKLTRLQESYAS